jgi:phage shock protein PspC (stress-responsive transcriptional regulator)
MSTSTAETGYAPTNDRLTTRQLRRSATDKMLGGVAGGIARYLDVNVTLVRIVVAVLALTTGLGLALYVAAWLLIPEDGMDKSIAETWIASRRTDSL